MAQARLALVFRSCTTYATILRNWKNTGAGKGINALCPQKGRTRHLPPGVRLLPDEIQEGRATRSYTGDMGRASYVLCGTERGDGGDLGSTCHGAGRVMSRSRAIKSVKRATAPERNGAKRDLCQGSKQRNIGGRNA